MERVKHTASQDITSHATGSDIKGINNVNPSPGNSVKCSPSSNTNTVNATVGHGVTSGHGIECSSPGNGMTTKINSTAVNKEKLKSSEVYRQAGTYSKDTDLTHAVNNNTHMVYFVVA